MSSPKRRAGYVYVAQADDGPVKIGISIHPGPAKPSGPRLKPLIIRIVLNSHQP